MLSQVTARARVALGSIPAPKIIMIIIRTLKPI
jgi:hypothetical protein